MVAMSSANLAQVTASALVPDQLMPYVRAVSGLESRICKDCVLHLGGSHAVLVAYPAGQPTDRDAVDAAVTEALALPEIEHMTVIAALRPSGAPAYAKHSEDAYWSLDLPLTLPGGRSGQKIRNLLRRAMQEISIEQNGGQAAWTQDHAELVQNFIARKGASLESGSIYIFKKLGDYLAAAPEARLFSARNKAGRLLACAIGDYSSFTTAFYMFAFRLPEAPPGTADALLMALAAEGSERGHSLLNLGLGIDAGVRFFKKKWGATSFLPYVETSWTLLPEKKPGWLARLFGR